MDQIPDHLKEAFGESVRTSVEIAETMFAMLAASQDTDRRWDPDWPLAGLDDDQIEHVKDVGIGIAGSVARGDYDSFFAAIAVLMCLPQFSKWGRGKWDLLPIIGRKTWRDSRDVFKQEISATVDEFLDDVLDNE